MDWVTLKTQARQNFNGACRVCPICNGIACAGEIPGMGGAGTGAGFINNVKALASTRLNLRTVHRIIEPNLKIELFGQQMSMPILAAAIGGAGMNMKSTMTEEAYQSAVTSGSRLAGVVGMTGDGPRPDLFEAGMKAIQAEKGLVIPVIKPRDPEKIVEMAKEVAATGAIAFGMDIDAAALLPMIRAGQFVGPKTIADLTYIKNNTSIPFIVKGIMTPEDAEACAEAGVDAIVVSNHGGRAMDHTPGTAEVLPQIVKAVGGRLIIMVDGGVRTGSDVVKMLGLGANFILVGRPVTIGAIGGGAEGVRMVLDRFADELKVAMILTGSSNVTTVSDKVIYRN